MEAQTVTMGQPHLAKQDLNTLDISKLTPLSPEVISRQATINIGKQKKNGHNSTNLEFISETGNKIWPIAIRVTNLDLGISE